MLVRLDTIKKFNKLKCSLSVRKKNFFSKLIPLCGPSVVGPIELSLGYSPIEPSQEDINP